MIKINHGQSRDDKVFGWWITKERVVRRMLGAFSYHNQRDTCWRYKKTPKRILEKEELLPGFTLQEKNGDLGIWNKFMFSTHLVDHIKNLNS